MCNFIVSHMSIELVRSELQMYAEQQKEQVKELHRSEQEMHRLNMENHSLLLEIDRKVQMKKLADDRIEKCEAERLRLKEEVLSEEADNQNRISEFVMKVMSFVNFTAQQQSALPELEAQLEEVRECYRIFKSKEEYRRQSTD